MNARRKSVDVNRYLDTDYGNAGVVDFETDEGALGYFLDIKNKGDFFILDDLGRALVACKKDLAQQKKSTLVLKRFLQDGRPDATFGKQGVANFDQTLELQDNGTCSLLSRPDGRILVVYSAQSEIGQGYMSRLFQCLSNGEVDAAFGQNGYVDLGFYTSPICSMKLQPDGKVLLVGGNNAYGLVVRLSLNGEFDESWGTGGLAWHHFEGSDLNFTDCVYEERTSGDRVIVYGHDYYKFGHPYNYVIAKLTENGALDTAFSNFGVLRESKEFESSVGFEADGIMVDECGRLTVALSVKTSSAGSVIWMARYDETGAFDASFNGGKFLRDIGPLSTPLPYPGRSIERGTENIVLAGTYSLDIRRYLKNGAGRDRSFGEEGVLPVELWPGEGSTGLRVKIQQDGKYLVVGYHSSPFRLFITRLLPEPAK